MNIIHQIIRLSHPPVLIITGLLYFLGCGVARYLGIKVDWGVYWLGQAWVTLVQFITYALNEYFELAVELRNPSKTLLHGSSGALAFGKLPRPVALWTSAACGLTVALLSVILIQMIGISTESKLVMLGLVIIGLIYSIPPVRLSITGYGELLNSFFMAALVPVFSFTLQNNSINRLIPMTTFPLICLYLAVLLIVEFPEYASDIKYSKIGLLLRLGWQRGIALHNLLIIAGFVVVGLAILLGMPSQIFKPVMAASPIGLVQIWLLSRIGRGERPNWGLLRTVALTTFGIVACFLTFGFWTH